MANEEKARITEIDSAGCPDYWRRDSGASACDDYDSNISDLTGNGQALWGGAAHIIYIGWDAVAESMGFRVGNTVPVVGALTWAYSDGAAGWIAFDGNNPFQDSTDSFTQDGLIAWQNPPNSGGGAWGTNTVDGQSAYWIKITIASYTTEGTGLNLLRNATLSGPIVLSPELPAGIVPDINGTLRATDIADTGPRFLAIDCQQKATLDNAGEAMPNMTLLWYWWHNRRQLYIEDLAVTSVPDLSADAYWKDYTGYLTRIPGNVESPYKMKPFGGYSLSFDIESATAILS